MRVTLRIARQQFIGILAFAGLIGTMASAATGGPVLLGRTNSGDKPTTVENNDAGAVLDLRAKAGQPPLKVNTGVKVRNLNADRLDGRDITDLARAAAVYSKAQSDARHGVVVAAAHYEGTTGPDPGIYPFFTKDFVVPSAGFVVLTVHVTAANHNTYLDIGHRLITVNAADAPVTVTESFPVETGPNTLTISMGQTLQDPFSSEGWFTAVFYPET